MKDASTLGSKRAALRERLDEVEMRIAGMRPGTADGFEYEATAIDAELLELDAEIAGLDEASLPADVAKLETLVERELALTREVRDYGTGAEMGRLSQADRKQLDERVAELERVHAEGGALAPAVLGVAAKRALLAVRVKARLEQDRAELTRSGDGYLRSLVLRRAAALRALLAGGFPVS